MQTKSKLSVVAVFMAILFFSSCASLGGGKNSTPAYMSGESLGSTLLSLYSQYKQTNKIDLSSASTLLSLTSLATNGAKIKENFNDKSFYADFASGVITGTQKKVTNSTVDNLLSTVAGLDLGSLAGSLLGGGEAPAANTEAKAGSDSTSNILGALTGIFSAFDK